MARGNRRETIFHDDEDRRFFLAFLLKAGFGCEDACQIGGFDLAGLIWTSWNVGFRDGRWRPLRVVAGTGCKSFFRSATPPGGAPDSK